MSSKQRSTVPDFSACSVPATLGLAAQVSRMYIFEGPHNTILPSVFNNGSPKKNTAELSALHGTMLARQDLQTQWLTFRICSHAA